jgi:hypothetical protein
MARRLRTLAAIEDAQRARILTRWGIDLRAPLNRPKPIGELVNWF